MDISKVKGLVKSIEQQRKVELEKELENLHPYWVSDCGRHTIWNYDCLKVLRKFENESIDLIMTDPPYGHNNNNGDLIHRREAALGHGEHGESRAIHNDGVEANSLIQASFKAWFKLVKCGSCVCCCCGGGGPDPQFARWSLWLDNVFKFKQMVVWDKGCFHPNTHLPCRINGETCHTTIANVVANFTAGNIIEVVSADGKWCDVVDTNIKHHDGDMIRVRSRDGSDLYVTPNHPVETLNGVKRADELTCDDYVPTLMRKQVDYGEETLSITSLFGRNALVGRLMRRDSVSAIDLSRVLGIRYNKAQWWLSKNQIPLAYPVGLDEISAVRQYFTHWWLPTELPLHRLFGWMVGFYAAEGCTEPNSIQFTHHCDESEYAQNIADWCDPLGIVCKTKRKNGLKAVTRVNSKLLADVIRELVPGNAITKQLSALVLNANVDFRLGVFDGWADGDGYLKKRRFEGVSASRELLRQMSWMLKMRGQPSRISPMQLKYVKKDGSIAKAWKLGFTPLGHYNNVFAKNDGVVAWVKITSLSRETYQGNVYDITVDHPRHLFYVDNGVLAHNSMGMGWHYRRSYETILVGEKPGAPIKWYGGNNKENIIRPGQYGIRKIIPRSHEHPTAKPVELYKHFIKLHAQEHDTVLDPFAGENPCGVAAVQLGLKSIAIEIDEKFCKNAVTRMKKALSRKV